MKKHVLKIVVSIGVVGCIGLGACKDRPSDVVKLAVSLDKIVNSGKELAGHRVVSGKSDVISNNTSNWKISAASDSEKLLAYRNLLAGLDEAKIESIAAAKDELLKRFSSSPIAERNDAVRLFRGFTKDTLGMCDHAFYRKNNLQNLLGEMASSTKLIFDNPVPAFEKLNTDASNNIRTKYAADLQELYSYVNAGASFRQGEGTWHLQEEPLFFVELLKSSKKNELKDFYLFLANENTKITEDAGLIITWDELRKRILRWERFKNSHPELLETTTEVNAKLMIMLGFYLGGLPNTRAYDITTGELDPELKKNYELFIEQDKASSFNALIRNVYAILKKHDFQREPELEKFVASQGIDISNT